MSTYFLSSICHSYVVYINNVQRELCNTVLGDKYIFLDASGVLIVAGFCKFTNWILFCGMHVVSLSLVFYFIHLSRVINAFFFFWVLIYHLTSLNLWQEEELRGAVVLIFANKQVTAITLYIL